MSKQRKAFTLVELLVVIAIIGILFVVLISKVDFATDKAKAAGVQTDFRSYQVAIETVARENAGLSVLVDNDAAGAEKYAELEKALNKNLDPKLHVEIDADGKISTEAKDPWKEQYLGAYLAPDTDGTVKDRGAIVMYSKGSNLKLGTTAATENGVVNVTIESGKETEGSDDYSISTIYTYVNGYGEIQTTTKGFSNNVGELIQNDVVNLEPALQYGIPLRFKDTISETDIQNLVRSTVSEAQWVNNGEEIVAVLFQSAGGGALLGGYQNDAWGLCYMPTTAPEQIYIYFTQSMMNSDTWSSVVEQGYVTQPIWISAAGCTSVENIILTIADSSNITLSSGDIQDLAPLLEVYTGSPSVPGGSDPSDPDQGGNGGDNQTPDPSDPIEMNGGLYDADDNLVADWATLVNTYGMDVEKDYTSSTYKTDTMSPYYVLKNNPELSAGVKIKISDTITSIGQNAFCECSGLTSLDLGSGVKSIESWAFDGCSGLTSLDLGSGVKSIESWAFNGCSGLTSLVIPDSVTSIRAGAFLFCSGLTSLDLGSGVKSIGESAFSGCSGLDSILVDDANTVYHDAGNCLIQTATKTLVSGCKNSVIPTDGSVTSIGFNAFMFCTDLTGELVIPDSVTSIGQQAFYRCSGLTSLNLGSGVTSIGKSAFQNCSKLTSITILSIEPPTLGSSALTETSALTAIYVPDESVEAYKVADGWSDYADLIKPLSEKPTE